MRGSERLDSVGVQLMPNGLLTGYKRKRKKRRRYLARRGRSAAEPIRSFSLTSAVFCSIAYLCRFRGGSRCSWNAPSASCSTSDLFSRFCASQQAGIGICSPPCSPFVSIYFVPHRGLYRFDRFFASCYKYIFVVVPICVAFLFAFSVFVGPCP